MQMFSYNKDNVKIIKDIPDELVSTYVKIGWEELKEDKKDVVKENKKENKSFFDTKKEDIDITDNGNS